MKFVKRNKKLYQLLLKIQENIDDAKESHVGQNNYYASLRKKKVFFDEN